MIFTYRIELWSTIHQRYTTWWKGHDIDRANIMMNKPYAQFQTRRLIKTTEEIIDKIKRNK